MKRITTILVYTLVIGLLLVLSNSCSKDDPVNDSVNVPVLATVEITDITKSSAVSGGIITDDGGAMVSARGVCWATNDTPTINDTKTTSGSGDGNFNSNIENLTPNTTYYVRSYATNTKGTGYGNTVSFTTLKALEIPTLTTVEVFQIKQGHATSGGSNINDGGAEIIERGLCFSTKETPTINDAKTTSGTGTADFASTITGLKSNTTYYVRAFATNSVGTGYGNIIKITSLHYNVSDVDGNSYKVVVIGTQVWMAENLRTTKFKDNSPIPFATDRKAWSELKSSGYCWYTNDKAKYKDTYGALYNWNTCNTRKLCPTGWHIPSYKEWTVLVVEMGGESGAGGKLKESGDTHWIKLNDYSTNEVGFTALPGGYITDDGYWRTIDYQGYWWTASEINSEKATYMYMLNTHAAIFTYPTYKNQGMSVRCIKD